MLRTFIHTIASCVKAARKHCPSSTGLKSTEGTSTVTQINPGSVERCASAQRQCCLHPTQITSPAPQTAQPHSEPCRALRHPAAALPEASAVSSASRPFPAGSRGCEITLPAVRTALTVPCPLPHHPARDNPVPAAPAPASAPLSRAAQPRRHSLPALSITRRAELGALPERPPY